MRILVIHDTPGDFQQWLSQKASGHEIRWATNPEEVRSALNRFDPEVVFSIKHSGFPAQAHLPALHYPSVRWFQVGGSGYEHLGEWDSSRVVVTNTAGVLSPFLAERATAGLLALSTGLLRARAHQAARRWHPERFATLQGKTLLIVGFGRTGQELAQRAAAFGMKIIGVRRTPEESPYEIHHPAHLESLWARADVVSLNVPHTPETHHLFNAKVMTRLPSGCLLLNGSRGPVVDEKALVVALREGRLAGAWLDVFEREPLPEDSPLWDMENVIVSAHCSDQVEDFPFRYARFFFENLERYAQGVELLNVVS